MTVFKQLEQIGEKNILPMHMPGHKRKSGKFPHLPSEFCQLDYTETPFTDDLHYPKGMILSAEKRLAAFYGARQSFFGVNGSTGMLLSAIRAVTRFGDKILLARNCHKSVYNAIELSGSDPVYLYPDVSPEGIAGPIDPEAVERILEREGNVRLVVITSPTYEGVISDITAIARICHSHGVLLLVDEAHGAHLGLYDEKVPSSLKLGADLTVQSLHKTLPSLTQTAVLHVNTDLADPEEVRRQLQVFESSSPSYLFLSCMDGCVDYCMNHQAQFDRWRRVVSSFRRTAKKLKHLQLFDGKDGGFSYDQSKLCILTYGTDITGKDLFEMLLSRGICVEMASLNYVVALTGLGDEEEDLSRLSDALFDIDSLLKDKPEANAVDTFPTGSVPEKVCTPFEAYQKKDKRKRVDLSEAVGRVVAQPVYVYPPGIPFIAPGERMGGEQLEIIRCLTSKGFEVIGAENGILIVNDL